MSKSLLRKKKKINVTQFENKFNKAIDFRIKQLMHAIDILSNKNCISVAQDFAQRLDELETLKAYLRNSL